MASPLEDDVYGYGYNPHNRAFVQNNDRLEGRVGGARPQTRGTVRPGGRGFHHRSYNADSTGAGVKRPQNIYLGRGRAQHPSAVRGRPISAFGHRDDDRERTNEERWENNGRHVGVGGARPKTRGTVRPGDRGFHHRSSSADPIGAGVRVKRPQRIDHGRGRAQYPSAGRGRSISASGHRDDDRKRTNDEHGDKSSEQPRGGHRRRGAPTYNRPRQSERRSSSTHRPSDASNFGRGNGISSKQPTGRYLHPNTQEGEAPAYVSTNENRSDTRKQGRGDDPLTSPPKPQAKRKTTTPPIPEEELQSLLEEDPSDILKTFVSRKDEFLALLGQDQFTDEAFMLTLRVLSCICGLDSVVTVRQDLNVALSMVDSSSFLSKHMSRYLVGLTTKQPQSKDCAKSNEALASDVDIILKVVSVFLQHKPSCCGEVGAVLILVDKIVTSMALDDEEFDPQGVLMKQVQYLNDSFTHLEKAQQSAREKARERKPPDNFRDIPIFPESSEIRTPSKPFLRKNIIKGRYEDVEHYLDVQFRLLREDFVAPLREGVTEYLSDTESSLQDIIIYKNARIKDRGTVTNNGFVYKLQFDVKALQSVQWESSKRLIYGSFVCLTKDNFQHILCATIEKRKIEDIRKGIVEIRFLTEIGNTAPRGPFIMAETSAYFEACRHVLQGLQRMTPSTFPFKKFIVEVSSNVDPPAYLGGDENTTYDLKSLVTGRRSSIESGLRIGQSLAELTAQGKAASVPILQPMRWPSAENLHLDESQKAALQAALTKEFVVIQGPPGTGKTYIGLKIIKTLLCNKPWTKSSPTSDKYRLSSRYPTATKSPILVVCLTNHALDQFLEGIVAFGEENVIRVGGRSQSEVLESKNLSQIRQERICSPHLKNFNVGRLKYNLHEAERNIETSFLKIDLAKTCILNFDELSSYLSRENKRDLIMPWMKGKKQFGPTANLLWWLKVVDSTVDDHEQPYNNAHRRQTSYRDNRFHIEDEGYRIQQERQLFEPKTSHYQLIENECTDKFAAYESKCIKRCGKYQRSTPKAELQKKDCMTNEEANGVRSIWSLGFRDRWRLYRLWTKMYVNTHEEKVEDYRREYEDLSKQMRSVKDQEDATILKDASVVGMTTTGAARLWNVLRLLGPCVVVVEEAAEVLEAHIITALTAKCQHLILIGDHQQLKPKPTVYRLAKVFNLDTSLFERMINNGVPCQTLTHQHRMRPEISNLMKKHFYKNLHDDESVVGFDDIKGVAHNMFFIDHNQFEDGSRDDNKTKSNQYEAEVLVELCRYLLNQGYEPTQITILTTYVGQHFTLKKLMDEDTFEEIRVSVVDNFQGEENDIILLSLVRSNEEGNIGFLKTSNRVCVALSRARMGFFCIGNGSILKKAQIWQDIIGTLEAGNQIGSTLRLVCQNHPDKVAEVSTAEDFRAKVPQGGCGGPCEYRLPCGHSCELLCHPYDRDHKEYVCQKQCVKYCDRAEHPCPKRCYDECGLCEVKVKKMILNCYHEIDVNCHEFDSTSCTMPCTKTLKCGHLCKKYCSQPCTSSCRVNVTRTLSCGHSLSMECFRDQTEVLCQSLVKKILPMCEHEVFMECFKEPNHDECSKPCEKTLKCGHKCRQKCGEMCQEKLDVCSLDDEIRSGLLESFSSFCLEKCEVILPCGHPCRNKCGEPCATPEIDELYNHLYEEDCELPGTRIATKCAERVRRSLPDCEHSADMLCYEDVDSVWCQAACRKLLVCGHPCINRCYQPCGRCNKRVQKTLPCEHIAQVPCSQNVHHFKCNKKCNNELACGHQCPNQCCDPCPRPGSCHQFVRRGKTHTNISARCEVTVQKALPNCHHTVTTQCFKDTKSMRCVETCNKLLACKHECTNKCGEPCKCNLKVWKKFLTCKHSMKLPCDRNITSNIICRKCRR